MSVEATSTLRNAWEAAYKSLANVSVKSTLMANQLIDMEWKFGVTAASDELSQVGSTFLHMKLVVDKGEGKREDVFMELTLPQFYDFMADMEKAKTYIDFLSN
jgi:COMM domain containing 7